MAGTANLLIHLQTTAHTWNIKLHRPTWSPAVVEAGQRPAVAPGVLGRMQFQIRSLLINTNIYSTPGQLRTLPQSMPRWFHRLKWQPTPPSASNPKLEYTNKNNIQLGKPCSTFEVPTQEGLKVSSKENCWGKAHQCKQTTKQPFYLPMRLVEVMKKTRSITT